MRVWVFGTPQFLDSRTKIYLENSTWITCVIKPLSVETPLPRHKESVIKMHVLDYNEEKHNETLIQQGAKDARTDMINEIKELQMQGIGADEILQRLVSEEIKTD